MFWTVMLYESVVWIVPADDGGPTVRIREGWVVPSVTDVAVAEPNDESPAVAVSKTALRNSMRSSWTVWWCSNSDWAVS